MIFTQYHTRILYYKPNIIATLKKTVIVNVRTYNNNIRDYLI